MMVDRFDRMEEMLGTLIKMVGENNSRLITLEDNQQTMASSVNRLEDDMREVKSNVRELIAGQERQERILEILSIKSIEAESYIQEFKRKM